MSRMTNTRMFEIYLPIELSKKLPLSDGSKAPTNTVQTGLGNASTTTFKLKDAGSPGMHDVPSESFQSVFPQNISLTLNPVCTFFFQKNVQLGCF